MVLLAIALALGGWIQVPQKRACGPLPDGYVCSTKTQVSFGYPAAWNVVGYDDGGIYVRSLIRFGTQAIDEPIGENGVAAGWYTGGAQTLGSFPGKPTTIGGMPAKIDVEPRGCASLGGDELVAAFVETRRRHARYRFLACLRGPDLAAREAEIRHVLASARFPYG